MIDERTLITGGVGIGSGLFGAILAALGFKSRMDKMEQSHEELKKHVVFKDVCEKCQENQNNLIKSLKDSVSKVESSVNEVKSDVKGLDSKLDQLLLQNATKRG
jgi:hypothetical protein